MLSEEFIELFDTSSLGMKKCIYKLLTDLEKAYLLGYLLAKSREEC